ncbi:MAG: VOC family protein [Polaromonas sp.]
MSKFFGEIRQLGYVVNDIEAAMKYWSETLGVGPWFYNPKVPIKNYTYKGEPHEPHNSVALANSGFVQVELIQTRNDVPSMYRDFLRAGNTGLQHVAYWTSTYDADLERLLKDGFKPVMSGEVGEKGRFIYFDTEYHPGTVIELSEVAGPKGKMFDLIRKSSEGWDGSDPVRPFPDLSKL